MSEAIDPINVIHKMKKHLRETMESHMTVVAQGVDTIEEYKYILGKIHALDLIDQEFSNLLEPKEPDKDDPNNVTRIRR